MKQPLYKFLLFLIVLLIANITIAQREEKWLTDSLVFELKKYKSPCNSLCLADTAKIYLLNYLSDELQYLKPDSAHLLAKVALDLSEALKRDLGIGLSHYQISRVISTRSDYALARKDLTAAMDISNRLLQKNPNHIEALRLKSRIFRTFGINDNEQGNYSKSLSYYFQSLKINELINDSINLMFTLNNMGLDYRAMSNNAKALECLSKALIIAKRTNYTREISVIFGNMGTVYDILGDKNLALKYHFDALKIDEKRGYKNGIGRHLINIGNIYKDLHNYAKARQYYLAGLKISKQTVVKRSIAYRLGCLGELYLETKQYDKALQYLNKALALSISLGILDLIQYNHEDLSELYTRTGNYKNALEHYKKAIIIRDSSLNTRNAQKITALEMESAFEKQQAITKIEMEKKIAVSLAEKKSAIAETGLQKQKLIRNSSIGASIIILLLLVLMLYKRKRDADLKQKQTALSLQISETEMKALRSQMNPHFILNALQSIQTFLMSHRPDEANIYLLKFSKLMRMVLENSQHSEVPVNEDMQALELYMQLESIRLTYPFTYSISIEDSIDQEQTTIPPLILQPFVENAIWHGLQYKESAGHINIRIHKKDSNLYATVEDDGVGRSGNKKNVRPVFIKKESLGMKLTAERLKYSMNRKKATPGSPSPIFFQKTTARPVPR